MAVLTAKMQALAVAVALVFATGEGILPSSRPGCLWEQTVG